MLIPSFMTTTNITATLEATGPHGMVVFRARLANGQTHTHAICGCSDADRVLAHWEGFRAEYEVSHA